MCADVYMFEHVRVHTCMLVYVYMCTFVAHMCRYVYNVCKMCALSVAQAYWVQCARKPNLCRVQEYSYYWRETLAVVTYELLQTATWKSHPYFQASQVLVSFVKPALHKLLLTTVRNPRDWRKGQSETSPFLCSCITCRRASINVIVERSRMIARSACHQLWNPKPLGRSIVTKINSPQILVKNLVS